MKEYTAVHNNYQQLVDNVDYFLKLCTYPQLAVNNYNNKTYISQGLERES